MLPIAYKIYLYLNGRNHHHFSLFSFYSIHANPATIAAPVLILYLSLTLSLSLTMRKSYTEKMMEGKDSMAMKMTEKAMAHKTTTKKKMNQDRFLIDINVFGSAGPIRFVVKGDDTAAAVIETALRIYGREGRLPVLGSDADGFFLYPPHAGFQGIYQFH